MELHQMIAQLALTVIEAKDKALEWERKESDRTIHKLIDRQEELHSKVDYSEKARAALTDELVEWKAEVDRVNGDRARMATKLNELEPKVKRVEAAFNILRTAMADVFEQDIKMWEADGFPTDEQKAGMYDTYDDRLRTALDHAIAIIDRSK